MRRQYRYFAIADYKQTGRTYDVLRQDGDREEIFVALEGWRPSHASQRRGFLQHEIDERRARLIIDWNTFNRFLPLDRPFRYFALTDAEHPVHRPLAVVRRWVEGADEHEEHLVSMTEWAPSTPPVPDTAEAVPIDPAAVDRFAAVLQERETGREFYHYVAIVDDEHTVENPRTVVRERPATGEFERYTENLKWEQGNAAGRRVPINFSTALAFEATMAKRLREARPHRYYAVVTEDHPDVTAPAALVRQHVCPCCLPCDEVYRANGQWVRTNAVIPIRAGERPGTVVPITPAAADALRETWTPRPGLEREPVWRPVFRYYAVVPDARPADDPLTVVRVRGDEEEVYTEALQWQRAEASGARVPITAADALRFEETQFRRVFGEATFRYYAVVNALHPDPEDPAAVVRKVVDDRNVRITEVHGGQWIYVPPFDERELVPVPAEKAALLRELCDARPDTPLWCYRGTVGAPGLLDTLVRFRNDLGAIRREHFRDGEWQWTGTSARVPRNSDKAAHFEHPFDIAAVRSFEAHGNPTPPPPPEPEYTYCALIEESGPRPRPVKGLLRTWQERKLDHEEQFSAYRDDWSTSWVREDVSRGDKDYEIVGISAAEAVHIKEMLVERAAEARAVVASHVYYAITDPEHPLRNPLALIRTWPNKGLEMVEEYTRATGYGAWVQRKDWPAGHAVRLTEPTRHRVEQRIAGGAA